MPLESWCSRNNFRSHGQRSRSNCWSFYKINDVRSIFFYILAWKLLNLVHWVPPIEFQVIWPKVKLLFFLKKTLFVQYLMTPLQENCQTWCNERWPLLTFRSHGQRANFWSLQKLFPLNISWSLYRKVNLSERLQNVDHDPYTRSRQG